MDSSDSSIKEKASANDLNEVVDVNTINYTTQQIQDVCDAHPLPEVNEGGFNKWRYAYGSNYRRLFAIALTTNIIVLAVYIAKAVQHPGSFTMKSATDAVAATIFFATVMRHEHAVNFIFRFCVLLPHSTPLWIRRHAAKVYCYGGLHSSCGISAVLWYIFFTVLSIQQFRFAPSAEYAGILFTIAMMLCLFAFQVGLSIYPVFRATHHDLWELSHRYIGWTAISIIWAQTIIITYADSKKAGSASFGTLLINTPAFWFLVIISWFVVYPWIHLRYVEVEVERLSDHAARLWFKGPVLPPCVGTRLSYNPLLDNHSFATLPNEDGEPGYSVVASNAGDFTKSLITNQPKRIWKRGAHTIGVARVSLLFQPLVLVATGSGIGPCLSLLQARPNWPVRILWSTRDPIATYGERMMRTVLRSDKNAIIVNTSQTKRPPLLRLTYGLVKASGAEAVVIISNPKVTREIVYGLEVRKVPAFGAIFDS